LDYPCKIAATIFFQNCNFFCPFCHNPSLLQNNLKHLNLTEILNYLEKAQPKLLEAVCLSGGETDPYYTNSTQLPVDYTADIFESLEIQDPIQTRYTGGTVLHIFLGEDIKNVETCKNFVKKIAYNYKLPYYTITPTFSICETHGYITGEHFNCPTCNADTEVYSRVVGYYRPIKNWNKGKKSEYNLRKEYAIDIIEN
ncbi:ribonucleoside-triphosphate reductase, partial [Candidatus Magnetomorum sp. HK-1]